ncbi:hypothetical protein FOXB_11024 [Fusarium oxysporum f. sp. conglutinans Fo5176]|uniref:Uncharacterized protein n=4 Tax=Fusarium oxysporum TaxID=5507 RepID=F9FX92_FUSOF|nr:hypothetical protein FOXB_11024 [Fusarium oxysporum f. sp. conglutinans Fo5176]
MCQDRYLLSAPCGHSKHEETWICKRAKSFSGILKKLILRKKCEPVSVIAIVIDWCPACKVAFERIVDTIGAHPVTYNNFWDPRLMDRYWSIKSGNQRVREVDPKEIGPVAFKSYDKIPYHKVRTGPNTAKRKEDSWELRALQAEVRRLKPVCVWIEDYEHEPVETLEDQLNLCKVSLVETKEKAYNHGLVQSESFQYNAHSVGRSLDFSLARTHTQSHTQSTNAQGNCATREPIMEDMSVPVLHISRFILATIKPPTRQNNKKRNTSQHKNDKTQTYSDKHDSSAIALSLAFCDIDPIITVKTNHMFLIIFKGS